MPEKPELSQAEIKEMASSIIDQFHQQEVTRYDRGDKPEILKAVASGQIAKEQLTTIIKTRYQAAHFFEDMLRRIIQRIKEAKTIKPEAQRALINSVQANLDEELGANPDYGGPHREGRETLLPALGVNYDEWKAKLADYYNLGELEDSSKSLLEAMKKIIDENPIKAVAALYEYEDRISLDGRGDYYLLLKGLETLYPEYKKDKYQEGDELWHIASHADHDEHHAALAKNGLLEAVNNLGDIELIRSGLIETKEVLDIFWQRLRGEAIKAN